MFPLKTPRADSRDVDRHLLNAVHRLNAPSGQSIVDCHRARSQFRSSHTLTIDCL
jgi:hypothetical protein